MIPVVSSGGSLGGGVTRRLHCGDGPGARPFGTGGELRFYSRGCIDLGTGFGLLRGGNLARVTWMSWHPKRCLAHNPNLMGYFGSQKSAWQIFSVRILTTVAICFAQASYSLTAARIWAQNNQKWMIYKRIRVCIKNMIT